jgi:hypothetical protein
MKTNLGAFYATDKNLEKEGKWLDVTEDVSFKIRRMGGANGIKVSEIRAMHFKPYARSIKNNTLDKSKQENLFIQTFVDSCLVAWKGLTDESGIDLEFTREHAIALLTEYPDLFDELLTFSESNLSFKEDSEDLGNS